MHKNFATVLRSNPDVERIAQLSPVLLTETSDRIPDIPKHFDGRVVWRDFLSPIFNQKECAACYSYAVLGSLADKYAIQTLGQVKPFFNPLEATMCLVDDTSLEQFSELIGDSVLMELADKKHVSHACLGDSMYNMGRLLYRSGAVEDSCIPYNMLSEYLMEYKTLPWCSNLEGPEHNLCCTEISKTPDIVDHNQRKCAPVPVRTAQRMWPARNFYLVSTERQDLSVIEKQLMLNMMRWGPVVMGFVVFEDFVDDNYEGDTIYTPALTAKKARDGHEGHAVRVVGWGEDIQNGQLLKYWICANSWGTDWGDNGYFKIERVNPRLQMEVNHLVVWPLISKLGVSVPFTVSKSLMTKLDDAEKAVIDVDPRYFYPKSLIPKIKAGDLLGDLTPVIDATLVPEEKDFWASDIGRKQFSTPSGQMVGPIYGFHAPTGNDRHRRDQYIIIGISVGVIVLAVAITIGLLLTRPKNK